MRRSSSSPCWPSRSRAASDVSLRREQPRRQLIARHLKREEHHRAALADGGVAREVQQQRGLANAGAGRQHQQITALETAQHRVQVHEAAAHGRIEQPLRVLPESSRNCSSSSRRRLKSPALSLERMPSSSCSAAASTVPTSEPAGVRKLRDTPRGFDQPPIERIARDDTRVRLRTDRGKELAGDLLQVRLAADGVEPAAALEFVRERGYRHGLATLGERLRGLVAPAVLFAEEVRGLDDRKHACVGVVAQQQRRDHRLLGSDIVRRQPARGALLRPELCRPSLRDHGAGLGGRPGVLRRVSGRGWLGRGWPRDGGGCARFGLCR